MHDRHASDPDIPRLDGWWGATPDHRFDPSGPFIADAGAAAWKMSTSPLLNMVPLAASLLIALRRELVTSTKLFVKERSAEFQ